MVEPSAIGSLNLNCTTTNEKLNQPRSFAILFCLAQGNSGQTAKYLFPQDPENWTSLCGTSPISQTLKLNSRVTLMTIRSENQQKHGKSVQDNFSVNI